MHEYSIIQALVIKVAGRTYAVPLNSVLESLTVTREEIRTIEGRAVITLRGQTLTLVRVEDAFGLSRKGIAVPERLYIVVVGLAQHRLGLIVDELIGQQDIVIEPFYAPRGLPAYVGGATILADGAPALILDAAALV